MRRAVLVAGLVAAVLLPGEPLGVAVPVVAALVAVAVARGAARLPRRRGLLGLLALALCCVAAIRDATWLVVLDLLGAWIVASVAVGAGGVLAPFAPLVRVVTERRRFSETPRPSGAAAAPAARGLVLGSLVVTPFAVLFLSADAAFAELAAQVPAPSAASLLGRAFTFVVVAGAAIGLAVAAARPLAGPRLGAWGPRPVASLEWLLPLALLNALFALFVAVQVAVLFGGHDHVLRTAGLTYAEYAREGFWQLVVAAALTLAVVAAAVTYVRPRDRRESILLRGGISLLVLLTLVVLASALRRLWLYEEAYGLTRARLTGEAVLFIVGTLLVLATAAALVPRLRRPAPTGAVAVVGLALLAFSLANPDARIAAAAVERQAEGAEIDLDYLSGLSADAVPELVRLPDRMADEALVCVRERLARKEAWSSWNASRERAREALRP